MYVEAILNIFPEILYFDIWHNLSENNLKSIIYETAYTCTI